ncbi:MAG: hypothetical protein BGO39_09815 [Chloroflexi bacterium 54-19]|nr:MAG: hypothetical protein BGO39_09815 [Chloroflexi bacterium 54-19]
MILPLRSLRKKVVLGNLFLILLSLWFAVGFAAQASHAEPLPPTSIIYSLSPYPAETGQTVTIEGAVIPNDATGTVTLTDDGTTIDTQTLVNGMFTFNVVFNTTGLHTLVVEYAGDGQHQPSSSMPLPLPVGNAPVKGGNFQPPADLVAQLRQTPDRVASSASDSPITYSFTVKNMGQGKAGRVSLTLPVDPQLTVSYASFEDSGVWVTSVTDSAINVSIPDLDQGQEATGTIVMMPKSATAGSMVTTQATVNWTNDGGGNKMAVSNKVSFTFGEGNRDASEGEVQLMSLDTTSMPGKAVATGSFWIPEEAVSSWLTSPDGTSVAISAGNADASGSYAITVDTTSLAAGTYVIAAYGQRSGVYGSAVLVVNADGSVHGQNVKLTVKDLGR